MSQQHRQSLRLDNGLQVILVSDPAIRRAAALMSINAGSADDPLAWPGLAHLLEHMLFRGSERFDTEQGLMHWVPAQGGSVNASTQLTQTAFFFEVDAEQLEAGVARLIDMLCAPLLAAEAVKQEVNIIDAEYHLLRADAQTLCEVAQYQAVSGIDALQRFHIGNRATFGHDAAALQQALQQYHEQYYLAANMTLWLQGPQSLEQLQAIVLQQGASLPTGAVRPPASYAPLTVQAHHLLALPGAPQLSLTRVLNHAPATQRSGLRLLECLLLDEAPGSLQAYLRREVCCNAVGLRHIRVGEHCALLTVAFELNLGTLAEVATIAAAFDRWLQQLDNLSAAQLTHYQQLANQALNHLSPLDQLRAQAFGLPAVEETNCWSPQLNALRQAPVSCLLTRADTGGEQREIQRLPLALTPIALLAKPTIDALFTFFTPTERPLPIAERPSARAPLLHLQHWQRQPVLQLQPATPLSNQQAYRLQAALRQAAAQWAHHSGHLEFVPFQGSWILQLCGDEARMPYGVHSINQALSTCSPDREKDAARMAQHHHLTEQNAVIIRRLLSQLPQLLGTSPSASVQWQARLLGGSKALHRQLSHGLSDFPYPWATTSSEELKPPCDPLRLVSTGAENALLLFFPLPDITAQGRLALRLLAQLYAPRYFQRLRVEQNTGYVAQCAYHCSLGIEGIFFALQSARYAPVQLSQFTTAFLDEMQQQMALLEPVEWQQAKNSLALSLQYSDGDILRAARIRSDENSLLLAELATFDRQDLQFWQQRIFFPDSTPPAGK